LGRDQLVPKILALQKAYGFIGTNHSIQSIEELKAKKETKQKKQTDELKNVKPFNQGRYKCLRLVNKSSEAVIERSNFLVTNGIRSTEFFNRILCDFTGLFLFDNLPIEKLERLGCFGNVASKLIEA
jgi:hypothetical protein